MKRISKAYFWVLAILVSTPSVLSAQAWAKPKGRGFYKLDFTSIRATNVYDTKGDILPFRTLGNYTTSFYGEYGVTQKFTVFGYVPFFVRNVVNETKGRQTGNIIEQGIEANNFGDVDLGFRYALPVKFPLAINVILGIPTGDARQKDALFTGDGEFNQIVKLGSGVGGKKWWSQAAVGFNNRTKGFSDEFRYDFEVGFKLLNDRLLAMLKINGIESFNNGTVEASQTGLFSNNVEFLGIGPEVLYYFSKKRNFGVSARVAGAPKGQNVLAAPSLSFGLFAEL